MASIIKRKGSPYWIATFDIPQPDGTIRRLKKSTKKTKKGEAIEEATRLEDLELKSNSATGEKATRAYAILADAADAAARGELSEGRARELIARLCEVSTGEPLRFHTVRSWSADWLTVKATTGKPTTIARYTTHITAFLAWLGDKADAKLETVTKAELRAFRDAIRAGWKESDGQTTGNKTGKTVNHRTAKTANHYAVDVAGMFRSAMRNGLLIASPAAALERLPEDDSIEREVFTMAEIGQLVNAAGNPDWHNSFFPAGKVDEETLADRCSDWQGMILFGFYAGARLGDCVRLKWGNVDRFRKTLSFMPAKTDRKKKRLEVPLHPRLVEFLESRAAVTDKNSPIFPALFGTRVGSGQGLSAQFVAIMTAAKVDRHTLREGIKGGQRAQHARGFHALRHSLTSTLANADVSEEIRRRIVGHDSAEVHAGYTHHERATLARAIEKLPSV
jgi:integrase